MRFLFLMSAVALMALASPAGQALAQEPRPGLGPSTADPVGRPFEWPPGLIPEQPVKGYDADDCRRRPGETHDEERGVALYVRLCLGVTNTTPSPIRLELPAGLLFVSFDDETQNGLLITVETFEIPPGDEPYYIALNLWCANADRSPASYMDAYEVGPITEDRKIVDLITQIGNRTITLDDHTTVQDLIWHATDGQEVEPRQQRWLRNQGG